LKEQLEQSEKKLEDSQTQLQKEKDELASTTQLVSASQKEKDALTAKITETEKKLADAQEALDMQQEEHSLELELL